MAKPVVQRPGHSIDFDFCVFIRVRFVDGLHLSKDIYPKYRSRFDSALSSNGVKQGKGWWYWTSHENMKPKYLEFKEHMKTKYGLVEQRATPALVLVHFFSAKIYGKVCRCRRYRVDYREVTLPAYAGDFGFKLVDHGMHLELQRTQAKGKAFNCLGNEVESQ